MENPHAVRRFAPAIMRLERTGGPESVLTDPPAAHPRRFPIEAVRISPPGIETGSRDILRSNPSPRGIPFRKRRGGAK
jgi:hypothetical protein